MKGAEVSVSVLTSSRMNFSRTIGNFEDLNL